MTGGEADLVTRVSDDLPALQIALPLLSAAVCLLVRRRRAAWAVAMTVAWGSFASACVILSRVLHHGTISYAEGGWRAPWGIELHIDLLNALVLLIVTGICAIVLTASPRSLDQEVWREHHHKFYALYLLCMTGLAGMTVTGDAFNIFVFLEISSLSSYALISQGTTRRALTSALQYLVMGTIGGTFILLGVGMIYMVTGTLNIVDMSVQLSAVGPNRTVLVALACIGIGTGIKLAVFPLHIWLPNAYTYAPAIVTAFLAATATKVSYYVLVRFIFSVFGVDLAFGLRLDAVLMPLAIAAMFAGSTVAIFQNDIKRMLAYSSVAQIGYMVLGLSLASVSGLTGGLVHLFNHAIMKCGLFLVMAAVVLRVGSTRLEAFAGLGRRMPLTMAAFVVGGLSLIGVPLTVGFVSKWYLVMGALERGLWPVAVLILLSSLLALVYVWRVVEVAYFRQPPAEAPDVSEAPASLLVPTWVLVGATVFFGIFTSLSVGVASAAARMLLGVEL
ncbi:MAG: monovalent cation/H+ antiporter subunit D family protein [Acidobacteria bacterium]|nr:monovalent cation/H+ antiporter subunit D family protein [Acidobacteriota bacterium]